jgi:hypothetical protein
MSEPEPKRKYLKDINKFEKHMILLYDWAKIWHKQAGGYTASDTAMLLFNVERHIAEMIDNNPDFECFREKKRAT